MKRSLIEAIHQRFGEEARFHTCSAENMTGTPAEQIAPDGRVEENRPRDEETRR